MKFHFPGGNDVQSTVDGAVNRIAMGLLVAQILPRSYHENFINLLEGLAKDEVISIEGSAEARALDESIHQMVQIANEFGVLRDKALERLREEKDIDYLDDKETIDLLVKSLGGIATIRRALEAGQRVSWISDEDS